MAKAKKAEQFPETIFVARDTSSLFFIADENRDSLVTPQPIYVAEYQRVDISQFKLEAVEI